MRIGEKMRFARVWPGASKIDILLRIHSRESAKRWCANRLPTKRDRMISEPNFTIFWSAANGGLRDGGLSNPRISEEKGLFPPFSGFSRCCSGLRKRAKKAEKRPKKPRFWPISGTGGQTPLKVGLNPYLLHPHLRHSNFWIIFGNALSVITEPVCFWNKKVSKFEQWITNMLWEKCSEVTGPKLSWNLFGTLFAPENLLRSFFPRHFCFASLVLDTLRKDPLKQAWNWHFQWFILPFSRLFFCLARPKRKKINRKDS